MSEKEAPQNPESESPQTSERSLVGSLSEVAEIAVPVAMVAQPIVAKLVNRPSKDEPPKIELPKGVKRD
jgi:hypothetical protein